MKLTAIQLERLHELLVRSQLIQVEVRWILVETEDLDILDLGCLDQLRVVTVVDECIDAAVLEPFDAGIALHHPHPESAQRVETGEPADCDIPVDSDRQVRIRLGKIVEWSPLRGLKDVFDDVGAATQQDTLRLLPLGRLQFDLDPGLTLPQLPQIDEKTVLLAVCIEKEIGRVVLVADDAQHAVLSLCRQRQQQRHPDSEEKSSQRAKP